MFGAIVRAWKEPSPFSARMLLLAAASFWSLGGFFIKEIDAGAMSIVFFRCLFSSLFLLPFIRGRRAPSVLDSGVSIAFFALLLVMYVASTKETTAANAIFLQYTAPIYVAILGPFILSERLRTRELLPFGLCIAGIAVLFLGNSGSGETTGLALGAGSGFFYGLFFIWLRRLRYADAVAITLINCLGVVIILAAVPSVWDVSATDIGLLVIMAAVQFALPYVLFTRGIAHVPGRRGQPDRAYRAGAQPALGGALLRRRPFDGDDHRGRCHPGRARGPLRRLPENPRGLRGGRGGSLPGRAGRLRTG